MTVIPVLDVWRGQVVHAVRGERERYRPVASALCASSEPAVVAQRLLDYSGARCLYVADLDALLGGAVQAEVLRALLQALPGVQPAAVPPGPGRAGQRAGVDHGGEGLQPVGLPVLGSVSTRESESTKVFARGRDGARSVGCVE